MRSPHWLRRAAVSLVMLAGALAPLAAGCGNGDGLVGGDCADGYAPCGNNCCPVTVDGSASDGTATDSSSDAADTGSYDGFAADRVGPGSDASIDGQADGPTGDVFSEAAPTEAGTDGSVDAPIDAPIDGPETGPLCMPPLTDCGGICVDTTNDPLNCGQCNDICVSQICVDSLCTGSTAGGIVFIGHDYLTTPQATAQARVLSNAVFIPQNNPLHVLSYERYANATAVARVKTILTGVATQVGRGFGITSTVTDADIPNKLVMTSYQVLIVHDQVTAPTGSLAALGGSWASTLATFTQQGGIVVVLDGGTGTGEMPAFSTATALLSVTGQSTLATGTPLDDVAPGDVVGVGVVSPYGAGKNSVSLTTEASGGNVVYVIDLPSDAGPPSPVVVHKLF